MGAYVLCLVLAKHHLRMGELTTPTRPPFTYTFQAPPHLHPLWPNIPMGPPQAPASPFTYTFQATTKHNTWAEGTNRNERVGGW